MIDRATSLHVRVFTTGGTVLYVDAAAGVLRHGAIETSPANAVFVTDPNSAGLSQRGSFMHVSGETWEPIYCGALSCGPVLAADMGDPPAAPTLLEVLPLERGLITFRSGRKFLCAEPNGQVTLSRSVCSLWECFLASEDLVGNDSFIKGPKSMVFEDFELDRRNIADHVVNPLLRAKIGSNLRPMRLLFFGYTRRSHGRVYYDLCKRLYGRGYIADVLDWQSDHRASIKDLMKFYDLFITSLDGVRTLVDVYGIQYESIVALSHGEFDIQIFIEQKGLEPFVKFAGFGVVSYSLLVSSLNLGVTRIPMVVPVGIDVAEFQTKISEQMVTVGYASTLSVISKFGVELKREELARECADAVGLNYQRSASPDSYISFHDMPEFYKRVDAILIPSLQEGAGLPAMEAAAAGRLVISTPVGHFPIKAAQGGGLIAPIDAKKFKTFTVERLRYYKDNPGAYVDKCSSIQEAARQFDWDYVIDDWIELIESAGRDRQRAAAG